MFTFSPKYWLVLILLISINMETWAQPDKKVRPKESDVLLEKLFIEASREKILGNIDEAIHRYLEVLQKDNNNAAANYELARLYKKQEQFDKAVMRSEKAVQAEEYNLTYNNLYASLLEKEGKYKEAAELYPDLTNKYPEKTELYFQWAYFLSKSEKADQAIKVYSNLEKRVGIQEAISMRKYKLYMMIGKSKKASQELEKLIEEYPEEAEYKIRLANFYASNQQMDKAKEWYQKALDIDPSNPTANVAMVEFFLQSGDTTRYLNALIPIFENPQQNVNSKLKTLEPLVKGLVDNKYTNYEKSIVSLSEKLIQTHSSNPKANLIHGELLFSKKQYSQALKYYKTSLKSIKNNINLWQRVLECLHQTNNYTEFHKMSDNMIELYPSQASSFYYHGVVLFQEENYKKAEKELQLAIDIAVADMNTRANALRYLGRVYAEMDLMEKSEKVFKEAISIRPIETDISNDYAYTLAKKGVSLDKAMELIEGLLKEKPKNLKYKTTKGFILYKQAKYTLAEQELNQVLKGGGSELAETLERYGDVLFKQGKEAEALSYWQKAIDKGSVSPTLQRKISTKQLYE